METPGCKIYQSGLLVHWTFTHLVFLCIVVYRKSIGDYYFTYSSFSLTLSWQLIPNRTCVMWEMFRDHVNPCQIQEEKKKMSGHGEPIVKRKFPSVLLVE